MRECNGQDKGRTKMESKERDILLVIKGLARNLALEKTPGIYKDDSS